MLLGLGAEPRDLTFLQISLRAIIVFLVTLITMHVSMHDLEEDMRLGAHIDDLSKIRLARVERSGDISFIKK